MRNHRSDLPLFDDVERVSTTSSCSCSSEDNNNNDGAERVVSSLERVHSVLARNKKSIVEENEVTNALANRAFHLPGYSYCADWCQYIVNNHLLLGMCCRHPQHPIGTKMRAVNLLGSALFGLAITNVIWLFYIYYDEDPDSVLFRISFQSAADTYDDNSLDNNMTAAAGLVWNNATETILSSASSRPTFEFIIPGGPKDIQTAEAIASTLSITKGMLLLWTVGGGLHAFYDCSVWYASACVCCIAGNRCESWGVMRWMGNYCIGFMVVLIAAVASFAVVLRAALVSHEEIDASDMGSVGLVDDVVDIGDGIVDDLGVYEFLVGYAVEFSLALFVYYPLFMTIMFTGALNWVGCGRIAWLGGRPYEMEAIQRKSARNYHRSRRRRDMNS